MSTDEIARLLGKAAADVPEPRLAEGAWARSRQVIRRRRAVGTGLAVAVLLGAVAVTVPQRFGGAPPDGTNPTTPATTGTIIDRVPATVTDRTGVPLPRRSGQFGPKVETLANQPVTRAAALYEPAVPASARQPGPVYVLGEDGLYRRIDAPVLEFAFDDGKQNRADPLRPTALSPDGKLAAFPQVDRLVVVNLTTGQYGSYPVPGFNKYVRWQGTHAVLVGGEDGAAFSVDLGTGRAEPAQAKLADLAGAEPVTHVPPSVDQSGLGSFRIARWQGLAWRSGNKIVRAAEGSLPLVAVIDVDRAAVVRALAVPPGPVTVLGWLDDHTVLVQTSKGVLAWDAGSGQVTSVATPFDGVIARP
jgi:hypothetical protein